MTITYRSVGADELDSFSSIGDADTAHAYRRYLVGALEAGETRPAWWFVAEDDGVIVGRIVFWSLPSSVDVSLDVFALPWGDPIQARGARDFLDAALLEIRRQGVRSVTYERHEPDPDGHTPDALTSTLTARGFRQSRQTLRFELTDPVARAAPARRGLAFLGVVDGVTERDFADAVRRCAERGGDTAVASRAANLDDAARDFVAATGRMRGGDGLWRIATIDGDVVGVILPTANDGGPVLNYVGVVPEWRGRRLVDALLAEAARLHAANGAGRVRADSDVANPTMHHAFRRAGWVEFGRRTDFTLSLLQTPGEDSASSAARSRRA